MTENKKGVVLPTPQRETTNPILPANDSPVKLKHYDQKGNECLWATIAMLAGVNYEELGGKPASGSGSVKES